MAQYICVPHKGKPGFVELAYTPTDITREPADLLRQLCLAITSWLKYTKSGQEVYCTLNNYHIKVFTLADLAGYMDNPALQSILNEHGICNLEISTYDAEDAAIVKGWYVNDNLFDRHDAEAIRTAPILI
jgi:hypothetical protein